MMNNTQASEELRKQTAEKRKQIDKLLQLAQKDYQDDPDNEKRAEKYADLLLRKTHWQSPDHARKTLEIFRDLQNRFPRSEKIALSYAETLSFHLLRLNEEERRKAISELARLEQSSPQNEKIVDLVTDTQMTVVPLANAEELEAMLKYFVSRIRQFETSEELNDLFAFILLHMISLSDDATEETEGDKIDELANRYLAESDSTARLAAGLQNLIVQPRFEESSRSFRLQEYLHDKYPDSSGISVSYAQGLSAITDAADKEACNREMETIKALMDQFPDEEMFVIIYLTSLAELTEDDFYSDLHPVLDEAEAGLNRFPEDENTVAAYARVLAEAGFRLQKEDQLILVRLEKVCRKFPDNQDIAGYFADVFESAMNHLSPEQLKKPSKFLSLLYRRFPRSKSIEEAVDERLLQINSDMFAPCLYKIQEYLLAKDPGNRDGIRSEMMLLLDYMIEPDVFSTRLHGIIESQWLDEFHPMREAENLRLPVCI